MISVPILHYILNDCTIFKNMKYTQKKGKNYIEVEFFDSKIKYYIQDEGSSGTFDIYPETVSKNTITYVEKNDAFKSYATYLLIIGIIFAFMTYVMKIPTLFFAFLIGSVVMFVLYYLSFVKYTIIESSAKKMYIIHDKNHDIIIKTIFDMRNKHYRDLHFKYIPENDPEHEIKKFDWLLEEEMITQEEYKEMVSQIAFEKEIEDTVSVN